VCAGVIDFADAIKLVELRGKLMQEAVPEGTGAMLRASGFTGCARTLDRLFISGDHHLTRRVEVNRRKANTPHWCAQALLISPMRSSWWSCAAN
jgi:malonyl CoA-acyl carrier protein transacylase